MTRSGTTGLAQRRALLAFAMTCATTAFPGQGNASTPGVPEVFDPPRALPDFVFTDEAGREHRVADFAGEVLVINLWATWCPPCVAEMPTLDRLQAMLGGERVRVLALSQDRGGAAVVRRFYDQTSVRHLPIWLDPRGAASRILGARGLPTTLIVTRDSREAMRLAGEAEWDAPAMVKLIRAIGARGATPRPAAGAT
ncbi:TlpA disulfide reductase family protein [Elioraea sp.]|uniref:TlpA family protein disulfide reductase n=1 Tax=Elioraea sp. TaxID=2185103 RepID=UPI0025B832D0|nr:TlpA disulfide reductase family protein [Elioraea sp.]